MTFLDVHPDLLRVAAAADARLRRQEALAASGPPRIPVATAEDHLLAAQTLLGELTTQVTTHPSDSRMVITQVADLTLSLLGVLRATSALEFIAEPLLARTAPPPSTSATT